MLKKKNRVFFHELGHFVANQINHGDYGLSPVEKIKIIRHVLNNTTDYTGETAYKRPNGEKKFKSIETLPQELADLIYGCYFQSLHLDSNLSSCFNFTEPEANGKIDGEQMVSALTKFKISPEKREKFYPYIVIQYFEKLKTRAELASLIQLNPNDYFIEINEDETEIDLVKLKNDTSRYINSHQEIYTEFISNIKHILEWEK